MLKYIGKRLLRLIPILLIITFVAFSLMYIAPGDPAQKKLISKGIVPTEEVLKATREEMGLDKPFVVRYAGWFLGFQIGRASCRERV